MSTTVNKGCKLCKKPFRPRGTLTKTFPNTVLHSGKGFCTTCVNTKKREARQAALKEELNSNLRKLNPQKSTLGVRSREVPKNAAPPVPQVRVYKPRRKLTVRVELGLYQPGEHKDVTNLRNFLEERRSRGIPPEGLKHPDTRDMDNPVGLHWI